MEEFGHYDYGCCCCSNCGTSAQFSPGEGLSSISDAFVFGPAKWGNSSVFLTTGGVVTWSFFQSNFAGQPYQFDAPISNSAQQSLIRQAFARWDGVANIQLQEVADASNVNIRVGLDAIDGQFNVLAEAFSFFSAGRFVRSLIRFDTAENFSNVNSPPPQGSINFFTVALHEIGHSLGLGHEDDVVAIMNASVNNTNRNLTDLTADDIAGIQAIYGANSASPPPPPPPPDEGPVPVTVSVNTVTANEGNSGQTAFNFLITLSGALTTPVIVGLQTANGTALAGSDYVATSGTLTIPAGSSTGLFSVPVLGDTLVEANETFSVAITSIAGATVSNASALGTIQNDDVATSPPPPPPPPTTGLTRDTSGNVVGTSAADRIDASSEFVTGNPDTIFGVDGNDTIFGGSSGTGIPQSDFLIGGNGDDMIFGEGGDDAMFGGTGNDTMDGGSSTDLMFGETGNDRMIGGTGLDALLGGAGADFFVLTPDPGNPNIEGIFDFIRAEGDQIEFSGSAFAAVRSAAQAVAAQTTLQGSILVNGQLVPTFFTVINFGTATQPQVLLIGGNPTLVTGDFIVTA